MTYRQPVRRQLILRDQLLEADHDRIVRPQIQHGIAELAWTLPGEIGFCRIDLDGLQQQHVGVEPQPHAFRHQPHAEEVAELQQRPVAPRAVGLRRAKPFSESMWQDRLRFRVGDPVGQSGDRVKAIDGHPVARRNLRAQAGLPEPVERAVPEGDDLGKQDLRSGSGHARVMPRRARPSPSPHRRRSTTSSPSSGRCRRGR